MRAPLFSILLAGLLMSACGETSNVTGQAFVATGELIAMSGGEGGAVNACFSCHGLDGRGDGVSTPRLAGLDAGYLQKQMEDYAAGLRKDAVMGPLAKRLDHGARRSVSAYYAAMAAPTAVNTDPPPRAYTEVDRGQIRACADCHGVNGEGGGPGNPAIAGQPAAYTMEQINRWRRAERRNDPRSVMRMAVAGLSEPEIAAIAAWLARQPASPPPDTAAASAFDAATAAARPAASHAGRRPDR